MKKKNFLLILLGLLFLVGMLCLIWIILNKKAEDYYTSQRLLYKEIVNNDTDDKSYQFTGNATNNYIIFNNLLWRIVKVNKSGSLTLILDKPINYLPKTIDIYSYLNNEFLNELDKSKLVSNKFCADSGVDLQVNCTNLDMYYVSLLNVTSYINTLDNGSFVDDNVDTMWLSDNMSEVNEGFHVKDGNISYSSYTNYFAIKPVVTLSRNVFYESGKGTQEDPFVIDSDKPTIGSIIRIDKDEYIVISTNNNYRLINNNKVNYSDTYTNSIEYLNTKYLESLSYNSLLVDSTCVTEKIIKGELTNDNSTKKVCMPSLLDFKLTNATEYYLDAYADNYYLVYDNTIIYGTKDKKHNIVPVITIDKNSKLTKDNGVYILDK